MVGTSFPHHGFIAEVEPSIGSAALGLFSLNPESSEHARSTPAVLGSSIAVPVLHTTTWQTTERTHWCLHVFTPGVPLALPFSRLGFSQLQGLGLRCRGFTYLVSKDMHIRYDAGSCCSKLFCRCIALRRGRCVLFETGGRVLELIFNTKVGGLLSLRRLLVLATRAAQWPACPHPRCVSALPTMHDGHV